MYLNIILISSGLALLLLVLYCRRQVKKTLYGRFGSRSSALKIVSEYEMSDGYKIYVVALKPKVPRTEAFLQSEFRKAEVTDAGGEAIRYLIELGVMFHVPVSTAIDDTSFTTLKRDTFSFGHRREFFPDECFVCTDTARAHSLPKARLLIPQSQAA
jgi:hypothetical protein